MRGRHLPALDGLRAVSVFTVMTFHFGFETVPGDLGVSAFFVLSGFLITTLLLREWDDRGDVSLRHFYLRRTLRIFPAYYAFVIFSLVLSAIRHISWPSGLVPASFLYLVNYFNATHGHPTTPVAHAWSLAVEEQFYLLWPAVFILLRRGGEARVARGLLWIIAGVMLWRSTLTLAFHVGSPWTYNAFDTRFDNLAVGCLLAVLVRRDQFAVSSAAVARGAWMPLATLIVLWLSRARLPSAYHYSIGFTVDAVLLALFMVQILQLYPAGIWRWLEHPVPRYLGLISYPLYLYHQWGLGVGLHFRGLPLAVRFALGMACSILLASGSYFVVEKPFLALKRRFEVAPRAPAAAPVAAPVAS
jgi:peptidoglycan/LPS O-acetylase OafA/YrhL